MKKKQKHEQNQEEKRSANLQQTYFVGLKHIYDIWVEPKCMDQHRATGLVQYEENLAQQ